LAEQNEVAEMISPRISMSLFAATALSGWLAQAQPVPDTPEPPQRGEQMESRAGERVEQRQPTARAGIPDDRATRARAMEQELVRLAAELQKAQADDKEDEAKALVEKTRNLKRDLKTLQDERQRFGFGVSQGEAQRGEQRAVPTEGAEFEQRLKHFDVALENLRLAGMPEVAERLAQQREALARRGQRGPENPVPFAELRRLRAEVQELRDTIGKMNRRLERMEGAIAREPRLDRPQRFQEF